MLKSIGPGRGVVWRKDKKQLFRSGMVQSMLVSGVFAR